jgi:hypothetical protein
MGGGKRTEIESSAQQLQQQAKNFVKFVKKNL